MAVEQVDGAQRVYKGTIIMANPDADIKKADGSSTYKGVELIYKSDRGEVRTKGMAAGAAKFIEGIDLIKSAPAGTEFSMLVEKSGAYWNVKGFGLGFDGLVAVNQGAAASAAPAPAYSGGGGGFKFPISKDDKGISICRQSALQRSIEVITLCQAQEGKSVSEVAQLAINLAREFEAYTTGHEN